VSLCVRALDTTVEITADPAVLTRLAHLLGSTTARGGVRVSADGRAVTSSLGSTPLRTGDEDESVALLLTEMNRLALAGCGDFAAHAGVVSAGGRAAAFAAPSGAGKSTLVAACLAAGCTYVSDEALVLPAAGGVRPYAKPLALSRWSLARLGLDPAPGGAAERPVPAGELAAPVQQGRAVLAAVLLLQRRPGPPAVAPASRAETAHHVLRHGFNHYRDPLGSLAVVAGAVRGARCWSLGYDDPVQAAATVRELLG